MYKIIVCDLDETLISRDRTISSENIEAIRKATEAGVKFVPCTGRGYNSVHHTTAQLGFNMSFPIMVVQLQKIKMKGNCISRGLHLKKQKLSISVD